MSRSLTIAVMIHVTKEFITPNSECSNHALENQSVKSDIHISPVPRHVLYRIYQIVFISILDVFSEIFLCIYIRPSFGHQSLINQI